MISDKYQTLDAVNYDGGGDELGIPAIPESLDWSDWLEAFCEQSREQDIIMAYDRGV